MRTLGRLLVLAACGVLLVAVTQPLDSVWRIVGYPLALVGCAILLAEEWTP